ncbi:hypothetical protein [Kitasatospora purpeofusca]|uniref:hypothetical protein n=1 Tax=Kitasatospora purpeofusca TaxID=67352 RepID=UPI0036D43714
MRQRHSFHLERGGHSFTVHVRSGWITETEVLVDGKEVAFHRVHGHGVYPLTLAARPAGERQLAVRLPRAGGEGPADAGVAKRLVCGAGGTR